MTSKVFLCFQCAYSVPLTAQCSDALYTANPVCLKHEREHYRDLRRDRKGSSLQVALLSCLLQGRPTEWQKTSQSNRGFSLFVYLCQGFNCLLRFGSQSNRGFSLFVYLCQGFNCLLRFGCVILHLQIPACHRQKGIRIPERVSEVPAEMDADSYIKGFG